MQKNSRWGNSIFLAKWTGLCEKFIFINYVETVKRMQVLSKLICIATLKILI